jgi:hypothetical protein
MPFLSPSRVEFCSMLPHTEWDFATCPPPAEWESALSLLYRGRLCTMSPPQSEILHYVSSTEWDSAAICLPHRVRFCTMSPPQSETLHYVSPTEWDSALCLPHRVRLCNMSPPQGEALHYVSPTGETLHYVSTTGWDSALCLPHRWAMSPPQGRSMALPATQHSKIKSNIYLYDRSYSLFPYMHVKMWNFTAIVMMKKFSLRKKDNLLIFFILNRKRINTYLNNCTVTIFYCTCDVDTNLF